MLRIGRVTVAYNCLEMTTAACGSLRLPNLAIMYLVAHYSWIEHPVSSASNHYMTDTCGCAQQRRLQRQLIPLGCVYDIRREKPVLRTMGWHSDGKGIGQRQ